MSVLEHIEERLERTDARLSAVGESLETLVGLEESIANARLGVVSSGERVEQLALSVQGAAKEFQDAIREFREATALLAKADPDRVQSGLERVEERLEASESALISSVEKKTEAVNGILCKAVTGAEAVLVEAISESREETTGVVREIRAELKGELEERSRQGVEEMSVRVVEEAARVRRLIWIGIMLSALAVGSELFRFFGAPF